MRTATRWTLGLVLLTGLTGVLITPQAASGAAEATRTGSPALELSSCSPPGSGGDALCGSLTVFEDRAAGAGRTIDLNILVLEARDEARPDPIFFLQGGPGGAATLLAPLFANSPLRRDRDIVLVDQRGTGRSNPLNCPAESVRDSVRGMASFELEIEPCLKQLQGDPRHYLTTTAMEDLDQIRAALGYERINLMGGSYGTRAALEYLRRYESRVRTLVLRGVAGTTFDLPLGFGASSQAALDHVLDDCLADERCGKAFPDVRQQLTEVLARLEKKPSTVRVDLPGGGKTSITVDRATFAVAIHYALYGSGTAAGIPRYIKRAHDGKFVELIESLATFVALVGGQISDGMFLSVVCAEDTPFFTEDQARKAAANTLLGAELAINLKQACKDWPVGELAADYREPIRSDVPTLLISGEADPVTPPSGAETVAEHLSRSVHLVLDGTAHLNLSPGCVGQQIRSFIDSADISTVDAGCADRVGRPPFVTSR